MSLASIGLLPMGTCGSCGAVVGWLFVGGVDEEEEGFGGSAGQTCSCSFLLREGSGSVVGGCEGCSWLVEVRNM